MSQKSVKYELIINILVLKVCPQRPNSWTFQASKPLQAQVVPNVAEKCFMPNECFPRDELTIRLVSLVKMAVVSGL